jgi:hypothetical protein
MEDICNGNDPGVRVLEKDDSTRLPHYEQTLPALWQALVLEVAEPADFTACKKKTTHTTHNQPAPSPSAHPNSNSNPKSTDGQVHPIAKSKRPCHPNVNATLFWVHPKVLP